MPQEHHGDSLSAPGGGAEHLLAHGSHQRCALEALSHMLAHATSLTPVTRPAAHHAVRTGAARAHLSAVQRSTSRHGVARTAMRLQHAPTARPAGGCTPWEGILMHDRPRTRTAQRFGRLLLFAAPGDGDGETAAAAAPTRRRAPDRPSGTRRMEWQGPGAEATMGAGGHASDANGNVAV